MTWLVNSMEEDISPNYMCYHTAIELQDNINQMYSDMENQSLVYELTLKLERICQGEDSITQYFNSLKRLWQDLDLFNDYEWKCMDDCNYYMVEGNHIYKFLIGLNMQFDEVRGRIIGRQHLPSMGEVFFELRCEERCRLVMLNPKTSSNNFESSAELKMGGTLKKTHFLVVELVCGVTFVPSHVIHERHVGNSMENPKIRRDHMKDGLIRHLQHT